MSMFFAAGNAQALYLDTTGLNSASPTTITLGDLSISFEARRQALSVGTYSAPARAIEVDIRVVKFESGPVVLENVVFDGRAGAKALLVGSSGMMATSGGTEGSGMTVSEIWTVAASGSAEALTGVEIQWSTSVQPVPEPSAALLFAVGLVVAGSSIRRRS